MSMVSGFNPVRHRGRSFWNIPRRADREVFDEAPHRVRLLDRAPIRGHLLSDAGDVFSKTGRSVEYGAFLHRAGNLRRGGRQQVADWQLYDALNVVDGKRAPAFDVVEYH